MIMHKHLLVAFLFATLVLASSRTYVTWVGKDRCASTPCANGESDCDNDGECVGNLICWQRNSGETDPRYDTSGINPDADVCVQPGQTSTPQQPPSTNNGGSPVTQLQSTCGDSIPSQCKPHIDWAISTGKYSSPQYYPNFQQVTGANLRDANHRDMTLYFYCQEVQKADCSGLLPPCCNGQACACNGSNTPRTTIRESTTGAPGNEKCWYKQAGGDRSKPECRQAESSWEIDVWGRDNASSFDSEAACIARERGHNSHCSGSSQWCFATSASECGNQGGGNQGGSQAGPKGVTDSMSDEFSGSAVDASKWGIEHFDASWKNQEKECYVPGNVKLENGKLVLTSTERLFFDPKCNNQQYFSGSIKAKEYFLHGTMEVRAKLPSGEGLWPAIWLLGNTQQTTWPGCGEIDLMEVAGKDPMGSKSTLHYGTSQSVNKHFGNTPRLPLKEDFHTWKIIRTSDMLVMLFDGVEFGRYTRDQLRGTSANWQTMFDAPMQLILNVAVGGGFTGIVNREPNLATWDKPTMEIDYIRTWGDATVPELPCLETVACAGSVCASCKARIQWLMDNRGQNYDQAKTQVANEFPNECTCDASQTEFELLPASAPINLDEATSPAEQTKSPAEQTKSDGKTNTTAIVIVMWLLFSM